MAESRGSPIVSRIFHIDSHNRLNPLNSSHTNFQYTIDMDGIPYTHCSVLSAAIIKSWYLIQEGFQTFELIQGANTYVVTCPVGTYPVKYFGDQVLVPLLNSVQGEGWVYAIDFNKFTAKYTFTVTGNGGVQPSFRFVFDINALMGFNRNSTNTFVGNSITSVNTVDFSPENTIFIRSDIVTGGDDVLQHMFASQIPPFGYVTYENKSGYQSNERLLRSPNQQQTYSFVLTNEDDENNGQQIIDSNGENLVIILKCYYYTGVVNNRIRMISEDVEEIRQKLDEKKKK